MSKMVINMMRLIFACVVFGISSSAFIDTLFKCSVKNSTCQKKLFKSSLRSIGKTGIPELDIPPTDPFHIENVSLSILNLVNITLVDGVAKGIKDCVIDEFNLKTVTDKLVIEFDFPFTPKKHNDGEIYFRCNVKRVEKKFEVLVKVTFAADNIFLGKEDVSELIVKSLNENWRFIMATFGRAFWDIASDYYFKYTANFFERVPAKYYIIEDLT